MHEDSQSGTRLVILPHREQKWCVAHGTPHFKTSSGLWLQQVSPEMLDWNSAARRGLTVVLNFQHHESVYSSASFQHHSHRFLTSYSPSFGCVSKVHSRVSPRTRTSFLQPSIFLLLPRTCLIPLFLRLRTTSPQLSRSGNVSRVSTKNYALSSRVENTLKP